MKLVALLAVSPRVKMRIGPVMAADGTVALTSIAEMTAKLVAGALLKKTLVTLKKLVPRIVTGVPAGPKAGKKLVMFGCTRKLFVLMITPPGVITVKGPVVALVGMTAVIAVDALVKVATAVSKRTLAAPVKLAPVITMLLPTTPLVGEKPASRGGT